MSIGRILTGGLGSFGGRRYLPTLGYGSFAGATVTGPPSKGWACKAFSKSWVQERQAKAVSCKVFSKTVVAEGDGCHE